MSRPHIDNLEALEKQLAELQMLREASKQEHGKGKKMPPAVPPKKKAQPQVPHSSIVNTLREPSYSSKISPNSYPTTYSNVQTSTLPAVYKDYANLNNFQVPSKQSYKQNVPLSPKSYPSYSNVQMQRSANDVLPPPPPPLPNLQLLSPKTVDNNHNEEYLPPPSPVSSNYSELVRATANMNFNQERPTPIYQNELSDYGQSHLSTYESLYEPINSHPPSTTSNTSIKPLHKEQEVDVLTNLLVQSISDSQDLDVFGVCVKCADKVVGESSGCTAMGNIYHVKCFCCQSCGMNLQGKPFYAVEGNPYCEPDYLETLEKCSVCNKPILDRILRATGKPYHPTCFTCVVCGKSLDGIPFTVDAMNLIHCIEDFHKKFAPRCCVCELPIVPEEGEEETVRVVALDRSFHVRCYRCEDCGLLLSSEAEGRGCYPLDNHILCKNCNAHRIRLLTNVMTTDL